MKLVLIKTMSKIDTAKDRILPNRLSKPSTSQRNWKQNMLSIKWNVHSIDN
jgi:hypothetical protein